MITIIGDHLTFRFPEVHQFAKCRIEFQRTLRIPDDGQTYPLPPGLGRFPLRHLDDFADRLPQESVRRGGVIMPIHQAEALWIRFEGPWSAPYPCAIKVATGKVCAISGEPWQEGLTQDPQNYVVVPGQPWLDGYCVEKGMVRQFVAMPLGGGHTAEEQLTGQGVHGGLQIAVYPMKRETYEAWRRPEPRYGRPRWYGADYAPMGLAPGGRMRQQIYRDEFGLRRMGSGPSQSVLRDDGQLDAVDDDHRRASADPATHSAGIRRGWVALVPLLRCGPRGAGWSRAVGRAQEFGPDSAER